MGLCVDKELVKTSGGCVNSSLVLALGISSSAGA